MASIFREQDPEKSIIFSSQKAFHPFEGDTRITVLVHDFVSVLCHCKLFYPTLEAMYAKVYSVSSLLSASPVV